MPPSATAEPVQGIRFVKAESNGNDFLIVDAAAVTPALRAAFARASCERHRGVGADGVEFVGAGERLELTLYNADGSVAEISGNGTRCVAAFYAKRGFREGVLHTQAGTRAARVLTYEDGVWMIEIELGVPQIKGSIRLQAEGREWEAHVLSVGNPQCVVRVSEFPADWVAVGAVLEVHRQFPQRTNVEFVRVLDRHHLEIRIFERGVGPTHSSGTGTAASAVVAIAQGWADSPVEVNTPGGVQRVSWKPGSGVHLVGPARITAEGVFYFLPAGA